MLSSQEATEEHFIINQHEDTPVSNSEGHSSLNEEEHIPKGEYMSILQFVSYTDS